MIRKVGDGSWFVGPHQNSEPVLVGLILNLTNPAVGFGETVAALAHVVRVRGLPAVLAVAVGIFHIVAELVVAVNLSTEEEGRKRGHGDNVHTFLQIQLI